MTDDEREPRTDFADQFVDDLASRAARHHREEQVAYATVTQLSEVKAIAQQAQSDIKGLKDTVEGKIEGTKRIPGLVDIVSSVSDKMDAVTNIGRFIGGAICLDIVVNILRSFGIIK